MSSQNAVARLPLPDFMSVLGMDSEQLAAFLINGMLINILTRGQGKHSIAWITSDIAAISGFRLHYDQAPQTTDMLRGGKPAPRAATDGRGVVEDKKHEVAKYLADSFGLTAEQAERIVDEAHEWQSVRATRQVFEKPQS